MGYTVFPEDVSSSYTFRITVQDTQEVDEMKFFKQLKED